MSYEFTKLSEVPAVSEFPEGANTIIEANGEIKRCPSSGGGGSAGAVLYTAQTLTDEQKKQARDNIDAAIADFVFNATLNSDSTVTLDKTFAQIQAAIQEGKQPVVKLSKSGTGSTLIMSLVLSDPSVVIFSAVTDVSEGTISTISLTITADDAIFYHSVSPTINSDGALLQYPMEFDPVSPMQIATKKYVDDKEYTLKSTTQGSTKKFKITVDDSGTISATEITA